MIKGIRLTIVALMALAPIIGLGQNREQDESGEEILAREQFFATRRAGGPGKHIPEDAYAKAVAEMQKTSKSGGWKISSQMPNWVSVNPSGMFYAVTGANHISGRTNVIAFDPIDANVLYAGAAGGGVWKTYNNGTTWAPLTDGLTSLSCGAIAVDPNNFLTVYFGTGEQNYSLDSYYGDGLYKSTDGGSNWTKIATTSVQRYFSQIVIDPNNSNIVYAAGNNGIYKSTDGGSSWNTTGVGFQVNSLLIDPTNTQVLYCSRGGTSTNIIRKSTDGGGSWTTLTSGLPTSHVGRTQLAMAPSNSSVLYASISRSDSNTLLGLYRTSNGGTTWELRSTQNYLGRQGWYDNSVAVSADNADAIAVGGLDIYVSNNGGTTLTQSTFWYTSLSIKMSHADIHFLGFNGTTLYCGSDGGVYKSTDGANTWTDMNSTISTLQYESADYDPTDPQKLYGGCQDNNLESSTDGGATWTQRETGDGGYTVVDPVATQIVFGQYVGGSLKFSGDYGTSFTEIGPADATGGLFYNPYELAPSDHNTVIFGRADIWKTTNVQLADPHHGWVKIGGPFGGNVSAIGISHQNTNTIYIGSDNGKILVTTDNGTTWSTSTGFPYVSDFAVDNNNDAICYATFGGFNYAQHISKTTDHGATWTRITGNLPNIPTNTIVLRTTAPRMLFVGTDVGVYRSVDDGTTWQHFSNGMPAVAVFDLKYKESNGILLAATHGRGCFTYNLSGFTFDAAPSTLSFGRLLVGQSKQDSIIVNNTGGSTLSISSVTSTRADFTVSPTSASIPASGSQKFTVTYNPAPGGTESGAIVFASTSASSPDSLHVSGYGAVATINIVKLLDADGSNATAGDRTLKSWGLSVYEYFVSPVTLNMGAEASQLTVLVPHTGTYIIAESDSGVPWIRINGNRTGYDTVSVSNNSVINDTVVNAQYTLTAAIGAGWNMISNPFGVPDDSLNAVFPGASTQAFSYATGIGYSRGTQILNGSGYFIKFPSDHSQLLEGSVIPSITISVGQGWNLIGSISWKVPIRTIVQNPVNITQSAYFRYEGGYKLSDTIVPGRAYWIKTKQVGNLTLSGSGSTVSTGKAQESLIPRDANEITFTDRLGRSQTLYFGGSIQQSDLYEMPPPVGMEEFDARYTSNRIAENFTAPSGEIPINLTSAEYPVNIRWHLSAQERGRFFLRDRRNPSSFSSDIVATEGSSVVKNSQTLTLGQGASVPSVFSLWQNFPNPFNPATVIRYDLPVAARVRVTIYDILGREVKTLIEGVQGGGSMTVQWDGTDREGIRVASGVYLYELTAVDQADPSKTFRQVRRMALLK